MSINSCPALIHRETNRSKRQLVTPRIGGLISVVEGLTSQRNKTDRIRQEVPYITHPTRKSSDEFRRKLGCKQTPRAMSMVLQCKLASGWELSKRRSAPPYGPYGLKKTFRYSQRFTLYFIDAWWRLTFADHADSETFLKATELATVPVTFVNDAVVTRQADILSPLLHRTLSTPVTLTAQR